MFNRKVVLLLPREVVKNKLIDYKACLLYTSLLDTDLCPLCQRFTSKVFFFVNGTSLINAGRFFFLFRKGDYTKLKKIKEELDNQNKLIFEAEQRRGNFEIELSDLKGLAKLTRKAELQRKIDEKDVYKRQDSVYSQQIESD